MPVVRVVKNIINNYTLPQVKTREATSNEPWFCSAQLLNEIAQFTFHPQALQEIIQILSLRLNDSGKNWRHVYKALILFEYLVLHGSDAVYGVLKSFATQVETLRSFIFVDREGRDQGSSVRDRSKRLLLLISNESHFNEEKRKARAAGGNNFNNQFNTPSQMVLMSSGASGVTSEIIKDRPRTVQEEELQLQMALDLSKKEAENMGIYTGSPRNASPAPQAPAIDLFGDDAYGAGGGNNPQNNTSTYDPFNTKPQNVPAQQQHQQNTLADDFFSMPQQQPNRPQAVQQQAPPQMMDPFGTPPGYSQYGAPQQQQQQQQQPPQQQNLNDLYAMGGGFGGGNAFNQPFGQQPPQQQPNMAAQQNLYNFSHVSATTQPVNIEPAAPKGPGLSSYFESRSNSFDLDLSLGKASNPFLDSTHEAKKPTLNQMGGDPFGSFQPNQQPQQFSNNPNNFQGNYPFN